MHWLCLEGQSYVTVLETGCNRCQATRLHSPVLWAAIVVDKEQLHRDILFAQSSDPVVSAHCNDSEPTRWTTNPFGLQMLDKWIYVPDSDDLCLRVLLHKHDHILSGHLGQSKTKLIRRQYTWPSLRTFVQDYCKSCTTCMWSKSQRHKPYRFLCQLLILKRPWISLRSYQLPQVSILS